MKRLKCQTLSDKQKKEVSALLSLCQILEKTAVGFPVEDSDLYYLLYDNQNLVSALSLFFPDQKTCECRAFTHPDCRRKGFFSRLLSEATDELDAREEALSCEICFYFITDGKSQSAIHTLNALEVQYWYSEYIMKLSLKDSADFLPKGKDASLSLHFYQTSPKNGSCDGAFCRQTLPQLLATQNPVSCRIDDPRGSTAGGFMIAETTPGNVYFFGFEIQEELRGRGLGALALSMAIEALAAVSVDQLSLQVSEQNQPALHLYKKTGFQITETLSYYLY